MRGFTRQCSGGKFTGLSGAGFSGNQGLDLSSPGRGPGGGWGGHEVKTKESLNQASLKDNSRRLRRNQQAVMDKNQRPRLDPTE